MMLMLTRQYETFITTIINKTFGNGNVSFKYYILPITWYNDDEFIDNTFKLASSGYSYLLPAIASGVSQFEINALKDLENDVLGLGEKLLPLQSAFTQSGDVGAPEKAPQDKAPKTVANEKSLDTGGSN